MKFVLPILALSVLVGANQAPANCRVSPEYAELRSEVYEMISQPYDECVDSVLRYIHWVEMATCMSEVVERPGFEACEHKVGRKTGLIAKSSSRHCEVFRPTEAEFLEYLEKLATEKSVSKCEVSTSN